MGKDMEKDDNNVELFEQSDDVKVTLYDENDNPAEFYQVACVDYEDDFYAILQPVKDVEGITTEEAAVFKLVEGGEEDMFIPVDSEDLAETVFEMYLKALADEETEEYDS